MVSFWHTLPRPFFALAPMEAVTDVVFRHVIARAAAPDVSFSEFTNATGWVHAGDRATGGRLIKTEDEHPIVAQLWGSEPDAIRALAIHCRELGYDGIDLNMGCPDKSAIRAGGGAHMIRTPDLAYECITAARFSGQPISVKTRLGYTSIDEWPSWLGGLLAQDIAALTVHLRTKKEMSKVPAHHELIGDIKQLRDQIAPHTLLIANGDIDNRAHGVQLAEQYSIDGIMIGRGVFRNPFAFRNISRTADTSDLSLEPPPASTPSGVASDSIATVRAAADPSREHLFDLLNYHLDLYDQYGPQLHRPYETLKRFYKIYINGFEGAAALRDRLMHTTCTAEVRSILQDTRQPERLVTTSAMKVSNF